MDSVVVAAAARTPLGAFNGKLKSLSATDLGKSVVRRVTEDYNIRIDGLYMGCVLSAGLGQSVARQTAIGAGLCDSVNCVSINKICGSGMEAVMTARNAIVAGEIDTAVAGGTESMSNAPYLLEKARFGYRFGDAKIVDHLVRDGLTDAFEGCVMGYYAEETATTCSFTRADQDRYAEQSFIKARKSAENGFFTGEIVPIKLKDKKGAEIIEDRDEVPFSVDLAKIPNLKPAFKEGGTVTAASSSSIADGAAAMLLMKESKAREVGLVPLARIVAQSSFSQAPKLFTTAPIGAIRQVLKKSGWSIGDVDLFEINEAFAVVAMAVIREFNVDPEKINVRGGACALGHPLGASGARIIVTLLNAMETENAEKGLAALCVGGGEGVAMTFERL
ncbi:MAG: thiolase family protein [Holosporaceae bacterium]|jgi:acetyl-CoA C-acetyltransferase|nr:thiolase family protein [Holosporaceae bacterium]